MANIIDDFIEGIDDLIDETAKPEDLDTHPLSVKDYSIPLSPRADIELIEK